MKIAFLTRFKCHLWEGKYELMQLILTAMSQIPDQEVQNSFLSSMAAMAGFQVWEYQKPLTDTVISLQMIPPSMMVESDIIVPLRSIVIPIHIVFGKNLRVASSTEQV